MWGIPQISRSLGQNVFSPPDVFNFYQPDFRIVADGLTIFAPPAQIFTTSTIIQRENFLNNFLNGQIQAGGDPNPVGADNTTVVISPALLTSLDALAPNPGQLVDALNQRMMHGTMTPVARQLVIDAVTAVRQQQSGARAYGNLHHCILDAISSATLKEGICHLLVENF